jgi:two-component system CheB/CheR fusion protein
LRVKTNGDFTEVDLTVRPVAASEHVSGGERLLLVVFQRVRSRVGQALVGPEHGEDRGQSPSETDARIVALEQELRGRDEYLHATQEEMQTSTEELRSANEELQSMNEELQSTNEELETSKEELQSVNEELATVNTELQSKVHDLSRVNNDMNNLLAGTGIGTVFVDHQQRVRRFTPAVTQFINLIQTDVGRPLGHIVSNLVGYDRLVADVQAVLDTLSPREIEVETRAGAAYRLRIRPYRTLENVIEGAIITFTEVTEIKDAQVALREADELRRFARAVSDARDAIVVQDLDGRILAFNPGAVRLYGWSEAEALTMNVRALVPEDQRDQTLSLVQRLVLGEMLEPCRAQRLAKNGDIMEIALAATALVNASGATYGIVSIERGRPA